MPYNLLELFKGTGSVGKVFKKDFNIISVDLEEKYKPTITTDILKWDYKKFYKDTHFIPDFIWASPPCNTYSVMVYNLHERNTKTAEPYSDRAKEGTKILYRTLKIIDFFHKKNPNMLFVIENPRGMMRHDPKIKKLILNTTLYCLYGDNRRKPTDFFSNFELHLKQGTSCSNPTIGIARIHKIEQKYYIPSKLIKHVLDEFLKIY